MKRRILSLILVLVFVLSAAACSNNSFGSLFIKGFITDGSAVGKLQFAKKDSPVKGIILTIENADKDSDFSPIDELIDDGYKTSDLIGDFHMEDNIEIYAELKDDDLQFDIYVVANHKSTDYNTLSVEDIKSSAKKDDTPIIRNASVDNDNYGFLASFSLADLNYKSGLYNVFFACDDEIICMVQLDMFRSVSRASTKTCSANQREIQSWISNAFMADIINMPVESCTVYTLTTDSDGNGIWSDSTPEEVKTLFQRTPCCPIKGGVITITIEKIYVSSYGEYSYKVTTTCSTVNHQ